MREMINRRPKLVKSYYNKIIRIQKDFSDLLQRFKDWTSIPINDKILDKTLHLTLKYCLGSYDAIHIATMEEWEIKDIAVFDQHIENIPNIKIWSVDAVSRYIKREREGRILE
jgi:predicted nucleic acid-binding protein